ncbi:transcriptional regulator, MerR family protein [Catenovulum agarivorans DS-2]|uniref:Transcriptional regulator, MerR family protein n=1 Tax=Catenovulum agarivorans DS-2 TaxID=1328313 RepID=W7Q853_9ALTE|nr:choice-of-anchor I family protein [Catenovulum agarivorans]EWH08156.1 transcriptional regulator, MerR family protein [Catenovulum agarivorans DS-2]
MFKKSLLCAAVLTGLSACSLEISTDDQADMPQGDVQVNMDVVGRVVLNPQSPEGAAEIVAFQKSTGYIYAINSSGDEATVEVIDLNGVDANALTADVEGVINNENLSIMYTLKVNDDVDGDANSIAIHDGEELLAVAMAAETGTKGKIAFYDISGATPAFIKAVEVGYLPDMVTFNNAGTQVLVANEGEPSDDYSVDPEGSISIIMIANGVIANQALDLDFADYDNKKDMLVSQGVKFANPNGASVSQDLEPEYVAVSSDDKVAFAVMQENNAMAVIDLSNKEIKTIYGLGFKNWNMYKIDVSDKDSGIELKNYENLYGMYQPDTIAAYTVDGKSYVVTANEGDAREYIDDALSGGSVEDENKQACETKHPNGLYDFDDGEEICFSYLEEYRIKDLDDIAPLSADLQAIFDENGGKDGFGRLKVTTALGYNAANDEYENLYAYGARSFSIFDEMGNLVFDSGDDFEMYTSLMHGEAFNNDEDVNESDTRSDAKGPEPEALAIGKIDGRTYAFIGLERMGGIFVYDITDPYNVSYSNYVINRGLVEDADITGDLAPEGMKFVDAANSPTGTPLLIVGNEISGSVSVWEVSVDK